MRSTQQLWLVGIFLAISLQAASASGQSTKELVIVRVLSERYETVVRSQANSLKRPSIKSDSERARVAIEKLPFDLLLKGLRITSGARSDSLVDKSVAILLGARDFLPPKGLGPVRSRRCYVLVFNSARDLDVAHAFKGVPTYLEKGHKIWTWSGKVGEFGERDQRASEFFATLVDGSYLLVANNRKDLELCYEDVQSGVAPNNASDDDPELIQMSRHSFWGVRQFVRKGDSVREQEMLPCYASDVDTFSFYSDSNGAGYTIRIRSQNKTDLDVPCVRPHGLMPQFEKVGRGVWEAKSNFSKGTEDDRLFAVFSLLGFGGAL